MPHIALAALAANRPSAIVGALRNESDPVQRALHQIGDEVSRIGGDVRNRIEAAQRRIEELETRNRDIEQLLAEGGRGGRFGGGSSESPGEIFVRSEAFKNFGGSAGRGNISAVVQAITSASTSAGGMIAPDRRSEIADLPKRRLTIRGLIAPGTTNSNSVNYVRQTTRTNNATVVSEGAQKPESVLAWTEADAPVRTIAHWVPVSRQAMDDAPMLQSTIDGELRYGLGVKEEEELLLGSGTGQHIYGIIPQATAYQTSRDKTGDTAFDTLAHAIAQSEVALLPATGIVMNNDDLEALKIIKDGNDRYIGGGPFGPPIATIWGRPVVGTPAMAAGEFLVGAFLDGAQIFDRLDAEVLVSSEDRDNFIKNMLTVRAEERLAMAVKRPAAFVHGSFPYTL
ncbi:phage major capsid protein [Bradyrhizobium sp. CIR3A]|uniref:phage major capsid protein n=1 Tax=Bradyrhizobium sp. CIR3A TaxID=2663838 RepID=UPI0018458A28|nr:phage major capsid protein [Bradyrhizobium sp. CIR3A]MBB4259973.1 HK97 family phage major capsid protein [Bradyrhizobium sp. CIR3A]